MLIAVVTVEIVAIEAGAIEVVAATIFVAKAVVAKVVAVKAVTVGKIVVVQMTRSSETRIEIAETLLMTAERLPVERIAWRRTIELLIKVRIHFKFLNWKILGRFSEEQKKLNSLQKTFTLRSIDFHKYQKKLKTKSLQIGSLPVVC